MKVISSMKKLKFWSRKKKKKKITSINPSSNTSYNCCCQQYHHYDYHNLQPSAPPLPPSWLDYDQTYNYDTLLASEVSSTSTGILYAELPDSSEDQLGAKNSEIAQEFDPNSSSVNSSSYQQYMVPNPVYGVPVLTPQAPIKERSVGIFGFVIEFGAHLIRCFSPCFRIREVQ